MMPTVDDQLKKKKPFKKKSYRSYLSLDETLDDVESSEKETALIENPILIDSEKKEVKNSPKVKIEPQVIIKPEVILEPEVKNGTVNKLNDVISDINLLNQHAQNSPEDINKPKVIFAPKVILSSNSYNDKSKNLVNSYKNNSLIEDENQLSPKVTIEPKNINSPENIQLNQKYGLSDLESSKNTDINLSPMVTFSPEVNLHPKDIFQPMVNNKPKVSFDTIDKNQKEHITTNESSLTKIKQNSKVLEHESISHNKIHQHAAIDNLISHTVQLNKGFTRVPNSILQIFMSGELSKHEAQTLAVILRMTIGFNKEEAPISIGVIQNITGIQSSRISAALNVLSEKNIIYRKSGSINSPNVLGVIFSDEQSKMNLSPQVHSAPRVTNNPKVKNEPETSGDKLTVDLRLENHLQYIYNKQKDSLPPRESLLLKNIISPMMKKERERIFSLLQELSSETLEDIELVFEDVFTKKMDTLGQSIKSELGYLELCFKKHKDWLRSKTNNYQREIELKYQTEVRKQSEDVKIRNENEEWDQIVAEFTNFFPTEAEQIKAIEKYSEKMTGHYSNIYPARRSFAIKTWFEESINQLK